MNTRVSIIVPCYNQAQYLDEALQSVLCQSYTDWECIIVNDGSPDNTIEIAKTWTRRDLRFKYLFKENGGLSSARNAGIEKATGEFILPLDADDKISQNYVTLAMEAFEEDESLKVVYCNVEKFGEELGRWKLPKFSLFNLAQSNMIICTAFFRKKEWKSIGGYDKNMKFGWEDWEFWIALLKEGGTVKKLDEVCFYYRMKSSSMVQSLNSEQYKYLFEYLSVKHADFFVKQYGSFQFLNDKTALSKIQASNQLKNKKYVIDLFCKTFFGFTVFNKKIKL